LDVYSGERGVARYLWTPAADAPRREPVPEGASPCQGQNLTADHRARRPRVNRREPG
jgi:hypothetical protein